MSLKRAATKLLIAFAAAKGVEAYRKHGGLKGIQDKLAQQQQSGTGRGGMDGRIGGAGGASSGGIGNILESLGMGGATGAREHGTTGQISRANSGIDGLLGSLAGALGGAGSQEKMGGLLAETRADTEEQEEEASGLMIRAAIQAARADGEIDADERQALMQMTEDATEDDRRFIDSALQEPVDGAALARDVPKGEELRVYSAALAAIEPDNRDEAEFLHSLAEGMSLDHGTVDELHRAMGKRTLYS